MNCPVCGDPIEGRRWFEDFGVPVLVEELYQCPKGHYEFHYAYGKEMERIGGIEVGSILPTGCGATNSEDRRVAESMTKG